MISLKFIYDEHDYIPALRAYLIRKPKTITLFIFMYLLSLALMILLSSGADFDMTWSVSCAASSFLFLAVLFLYAFPRWRFQHSYKAVDEQRIQVNEQGIFTETEFDHAVLPWRRCTMVLEGKGYYAFEHDHRRITVIPKRAFQNGSEENTFREIVRSRLTPALSSKLRKRNDPEPSEEFAPADKMPDWR